MVSLAILVFSTDFKGEIFVCVFEQNQGVRVDMMMWSRSNRQSPLNWKMHENSLLWKNIQNMSAHTRHDSHSSQKGNVWEQEGVTDFFFQIWFFWLIMILKVELEICHRCACVTTLLLLIWMNIIKCVFGYRPT